MNYILTAFDVDGTLTRHVSSWQYLHERLGQWDGEAFRYQEQFLAGRISYRKFCRLDAAHWKGLDASRVAEIFESIPFALNAERAVETLKRRGFKLAAVSTGLQFMTDRIKNELGFDYVIGNRLRVRKGLLTGGVDVRISHMGKGRVLRGISKRFGIPPRRMVVVGDSRGDIPMMRLAGYAIAFNSSSPEVRAAADYSCRSLDLMEVSEKILEIA